MFEIKWSLRALKQAKAFPGTDRERIVKGVETLQSWPNCKNIKALEDHKYPYRLRVGKYRIFFTIDKYATIIAVEEVRKRDERTYQASGY